MAHGIAGAVDGMAGGVFCVTGPVGARSHIQVGLVRVGGPEANTYFGHALQIILRRGQHREIVPGLTRDRLAREGVGNDLRRSGQQLIAAGIAAAVVEGLEVFQVEGQIDRLFPLRQALRQIGFCDLFKIMHVRDAGQIIGDRDPSELPGLCSVAVALMVNGDDQDEHGHKGRDEVDIIPLRKLQRIARLVVGVVVQKPDKAPAEDHDQQDGGIGPPDAYDRHIHEHGQKAQDHAPAREVMHGQGHAEIHGQQEISEDDLPAVFAEIPQLLFQKQRAVDKQQQGRRKEPPVGTGVVEKLPHRGDLARQDPVFHIAQQHEDLNDRYDGREIDRAAHVRLLELVLYIDGIAVKAEEANDRIAQTSLFFL